MERVLGFGGKSAEDNVLDGFITGKAYIIDNELLPANSKNNGNKLASVRVTDQLNLPVGLQIRFRPLGHFYQVGYLIQLDADAVQPVEVELTEVYLVVGKHLAEGVMRGWAVERGVSMQLSAARSHDPNTKPAAPGAGAAGEAGVSMQFTACGQSAQPLPSPFYWGQGCLPQ